MTNVLQRTRLFFVCGLIAAALGSVFLLLPAWKAFADSSGPSSPGTTADDSSVGTIAWSNTGNADSSNDSYATASLFTSEVSHYLKATNFGFSLPASTINGITVEWEKKDDPLNQIYDNAVRIVKGGTIGSTDRADVNVWTNTDAYTTYGGASDLWGETWTTSDINASTFGAALSAKENGFAPGVAYLDHVRITVSYTPTSRAKAVMLVQTRELRLNPS